MIVLNLSLAYEFLLGIKFYIQQYIILLYLKKLQCAVFTFLHFGFFFGQQTVKNEKQVKKIIFLALLK